MSGSEKGFMSESRDSMPSLWDLRQQLQQSQAPSHQSQNMQLPFPGADNEADPYNLMMSEASPLLQYQPNSASADPAVNMNLPVKRGRGRPKKYAPVNNETSLALAPAGPSFTVSQPYNPMMSEASPPPQYQPNSASVNPAVNMNMNMSVKRGRGRPRKYAPVNAETSLALVPGGPSFTVSQPSGSHVRFKKMRGRGQPSSSANRNNLQALGSTGVGFTPHLLTILPGEDITAKITGPNMNRPHSVCVISAYGCISSASLRPPISSGGNVTYEGRFEILSLSGSFVSVETDGHNNRTGGLSVTLSRLDGGVFGGSVAGPLIAATPIQIVVGSLISEGPEQHVEQMEIYIPTHPTLALPHEDSTEALVGQSSPQFRSIMSESSDEGEHENPWYNTNLTMSWK